MSDWQSAFASLLKTNMGCCAGERILVFSDLVRDDEHLPPADADRRQRLHAAAGALADCAQKEYGNAQFVSFPATAASGAEPPEAVWHAVFGEQLLGRLSAHGILARLLAKEATSQDLRAAKEIVTTGREAVAQVIVAMSNNSTSHTRFRDLANAAGSRFASLPHFDPEMFFSSMAVDWQALAARTDRLAVAVNRAARIHVTTPNGTDIWIDKEGRTAKGDDGLLIAPGSFGNLPAGEVYLAPVEGSSSGVMVLEYAPLRRLSSPLSLVVEHGEVVGIHGDDSHREFLERKFAESAKNRNIAELGIGTNDKATRPDNILEAEKILGTIHIALGDNSGFGGTVSTPFHEDYVFCQPTVTTLLPGGEEEALLEGGVLCV